MHPEIRPPNLRAILRESIDMDIPGLEQLWDETVGEPQICIAVLDGPVDLSHPAFQGANLTQLETLAGRGDGQSASSSHGTHVASVIFGQHDGPVRGVAPGCCGLILPVFSEAGDGSLIPCSQLDLARAITQAANHGAHVINISGGQLEASGEPHPMLAQAIRRCADENILIVAAAGNDGCQCLHVPAAVPSVLAVGATDATGDPLPSSNWGPLYEIQGILAPGENIAGAVPHGGVAAHSGTSFATPTVSGVAGLLLSVQIQRGVQPDPQAVRQALLDSAYACNPLEVADCRRYMVGSLNVSGAYSLVTAQAHHASGSSDEGIMPRHNAIERRQQMPVAQTKASSRSMAATPRRAPAAIHRRAAVTPSQVQSPAQLGQADTLVYALGEIGYDFGTEARQDAIVDAMGPDDHGNRRNPYDPRNLLAYLDDHPYEAPALIWTLNVDATSIYAIQPAGPYAHVAFERLREFLRAQLNKEVERVSIPGVVAGELRLMSGQRLPVIVPEPRGMFSWTTQALIESVIGKPPPTRHTNRRAEYDQKQTGLRNFLDRIYYEIRNLGLSPQERALNFAATNAFQIEQVFIDSAAARRVLDQISVERSPICRPDSDCWDVLMSFFDPENVLRSRRISRFTIDVSDVVPVMVGEIRSWDAR